MKKISSILLVSVFSFLFSSVLFAQGKPDALKLYREGSYREAISICEQEIASNPSNLDSHAVLCWSLVANKQYNEAEQRATEARKINQYKRCIDELVDRKLISESATSDKLTITSAGVDALEAEQERRWMIRWDAFRYVVTTAIALIALVISIISLFAR